MSDADALMWNIDEVHVGINSDMAAVPDPDVLLECMQKSFDVVLKQA